jgi:hypothetical protein
MDMKEITICVKDRTLEEAAVLEKRINKLAMELKGCRMEGALEFDVEELMGLNFVVAVCE